MKIKFQFLGLALVLITSLYHLFGQEPNFLFSCSPGVGQFPYAVCASDINGDGKLDLISADNYSGTLTVLTNDGSGGFVLASTFHVGSPTSVCAADVNGDGKMDLICADFGMNNSYLKTLTIMTNDGNGGFALVSAPIVGDGPDSVCATDANGDGKMDLICANAVGQTLTVLTNDGKGDFNFSSLLPGGISAECVIAADINGDGKADLICANYESPLMIYTNDGSGGFVFASQYPMGGADCVAAADVNSDGKVDLICSTYSGFPPPGYTNYSYLMILTNGGSGNFQLSSSLYVLGNGNAVCAADVNGDGKVDLITANSAYYNDSFGFGGYYITNALTMFTNDGNGNFAFAASPGVGIEPYWVIAADVNGDGKVDLISAIAGDNTLTVLTNATIFSPPVSTPPLTIQSSGFEIQVSWPSVSPGWSLEQNPTLTTGNWEPSGYSGFSIFDDGTNKSLAMPASGNMFFRLLHP